MFQGFSDETFEFFMAIRFNNNREFFQSNRDWYLRAVREPCLALAEALNPAVEALDDELERRPGRVVSRINRDIRFSHDKSPYRDYIWLAFRRPGEQRSTTLGVYFDISASGAAWGMGYYAENRAMMNGLRRRLLAEPDTFLNLWQPVTEEFPLHVERPIKRLPIPESLHPALRQWYPMRSFYLQRDCRDFALMKSPKLADAIADGFAKLAPMYRYLTGIVPEPDADLTREVTEPMSLTAGGSSE